MIQRAKGGARTVGQVTILMGTRDAGPYLAPQLHSIAAQQGVDWRLWISDDGSTDRTVELARAFAGAQPRGRVRLLRGPGRGPAANFLHMLGHPDLPAGPVAFSDQDDVWDHDKLARALSRLDDITGAALYGAGWRLPGRPQPRPPATAPGLRNAVVQNVISGHTTVLNAPGAVRMREMLPIRPVPFHDWWLYLAMSALGGVVIRDHRAVLDYRQHQGNAMGTNTGRRARLARLGLLVSGRWGGWVWQNLAALSDHRDALSAEAREILDALTGADSAGALAAAMRDQGLHRASAAETRLIRALPLIRALRPYR